jgi:hypothetical protein
MSEIDDMTASVLAHWHRADPARKRAFCELLRRVGEKDMTVTEAAEQYWVELGLSEADARACPSQQNYALKHSACVNSRSTSLTRKCWRKFRCLSWSWNVALAR